MSHDEELLDLSRRVVAEPENEALCSSYERALLRAGRVEEVRRRNWDRLRCTLSWDNLPADARSPSLRRCLQCGKDVTRAETEGQRREAITAGHCVAGGSSLREGLLDELVSRLELGETAALPPCFVEANGEPAPGEPDQANRYARCGCLIGVGYGHEQEPPHAPRFHTEVQDTDCEAWSALLSYIDDLADAGGAVFAPARELGRELWSQIVTLPASIARLERVESMALYGSHLVRIPPQIGAMKSLRSLDPYTSYRLHWLPYEVTRCLALSKSRFSTRTLYGNYKFRSPFPDLEVERGPEPEICSVCDQPAEQFQQAWISLLVATDVLPLLVNACSKRCLESLPSPPQQYVPGPHRGGAGVQQPGRGF